MQRAPQPSPRLGGVSLGRLRRGRSLHWCLCRRRRLHGRLRRRLRRLRRLRRRLSLDSRGSGGLRGEALLGFPRGQLLRFAAGGVFLGFAARPRLGLQAGTLLGFLTGAFLLGAEHVAALGDHVPDGARDERAGADRVVVAGDHEVDPVGVAVGVHEPDDGDAQPLRLAHGDGLGFEVDHEHRVGYALHVFDPPQIGAQLEQVGLAGHALAGGEQRQLALGLEAFEVVEAADAEVDGLEVGEQSAQPAVVDVGHPGGGGDIADDVPSLLLGAHEQHGPPTVGEGARELAGLFEQDGGLEKVDDVDAAALAMDEAAHLGVPAARLVAEMDAGLQQFRDAYLSHGLLPYEYALVGGA